MPNIRPVSDLRSYAAILKNVSAGSPVYLTKNGRGTYAIVAIEEYEDLLKASAKIQLMMDLEKGRRSGEEQGWISESDLKYHFESRFNGK